MPKASFEETHHATVYFGRGTSRVCRRGAMGSRLVRRLLESEYQVGVYGRDLRRAAELAFYGAIEAESLSQLADNTDVLLWWLTNDDAVRDVYLRRDAVAAAMQAGKAVLEMSTITPETSRDVDAAAA